MSFVSLTVAFALSFLAAFVFLRSVAPARTIFSAASSNTSRDACAAVLEEKTSSKAEMLTAQFNHAAQLGKPTSTDPSKYGCFDLHANPFDSPCGIVVHAMVPRQYSRRHQTTDKYFADIIDEVVRWRSLSFVAHLPVVIATNAIEPLSRLLVTKLGGTHGDRVRALSVSSNNMNSSNAPSLFDTALATPFSRTLLVNSSIQLPQFDLATAPPTVLLPLLEWYDILLVPLPSSNELLCNDGLRLFHPGLVLFQSNGWGGEAARGLLAAAHSKMMNVAADGDDAVSLFLATVHALSAAVAESRRSRSSRIAEIDPAFCVDRHRFPNDTCSAIRNIPPKLRRVPIDTLLTRCDVFRI